MKALKKLDKAVTKLFSAFSMVCSIISIIGLVVIMAMLMIQTVLMWFSISILWSDELVSVMNVWLVFMAATVVSHEKAHVQVDFITNMLPKVIQKLLAITMNILSIIACAFVFKGGIIYLQRTQNMATNILKLPMSAIYVAPLIALGLMMLMNTVDIIKGIAGLFTGKYAEAVKGGAKE